MNLIVRSIIFVLLASPVYGQALVSSTSQNFSIYQIEDGPRTNHESSSDARIADRVISRLNKLSFQAELINDAVVLQWTDEMRNSSKNFVLERSSDGEIFEFVRTIDALIGENEIPYLYKDNLPLGGSSNSFVYYRLSQVGNDGIERRYAPIALYLRGTQASNEVVHISNSKKLKLDGISGKGNWTLYTINGELVKSGAIDSAMKLSTKGLDPGSYLLELDDLQGSIEERILIVN